MTQLQQSLFKAKPNDLRELSLIKALAQFISLKIRHPREK